MPSALNGNRKLLSPSPAPGILKERMPDSPLLLCLDYGTAKVGVAIGSLVPSQPLEVVRYGSLPELESRLRQIVEQERPEGMVIGWPADTLSENTVQTEVIRRFGEQFGQSMGLPVVYFPETLTTQLASQKMIEAGISKMKRREVEDSYAAAAILDSYLESIA